MNRPKAEELRLPFPGDTSARTETVSIEEAARLAHVHPRTIEKWRKAGKIEGTNKDIALASLTHYMEQRRLASLLRARPSATILQDVAIRPEVLGKQLVVLLQRMTVLEHRLMVVESQDQSVKILERELADTKRQLLASQQRETTLLNLLRGRTGLTEPPVVSPPPPPVRPMPLRERILAYLRQDTPPAKNASQVQQALRLSTSPQRELRRLVTQGLVTRIKPGLYTAVAGSPAATAQADSLLEQVWRVVQQAGQPLRAPEVQALLQQRRSVYQELSQLVQERRLRRVEPGLYAIPDAPGDAMVDSGAYP